MRNPYRGVLEAWETIWFHPTCCHYIKGNNIVFGPRDLKEREETEWVSGDDWERRMSGPYNKNCSIMVPADIIEDMCVKANRNYDKFIERCKAKLKEK